jgi:hypothetical protein
MVTTGAGVYFLQQLTALISEDAPHEYAGSPALVELVVDEDKSFCSAGDAPGFRLVGRELPLDKPLEDGELSHLFSEEKPSASLMCARISLHTYYRQNE